MADNWDEYVVKEQPTDEWSQYVVDKTSKKSLGDLGGDLLGGAIGLGAAGGVGYGLVKSGIPQNIGKGISQLSRGLVNLPKITNATKGTKFAEQIRSAFISAHTDKVNAFGNNLDKLAQKNPNKTVSLSDAVNDIVDNWQELSPTTKSALRKTPILDSFLKKAKEGKISGNPESVSLKGTQEIINHLNNKIPKEIKASNLDLVDTLNNIKASQLDAFPEMEQVRADYKKFIEPYKNVKQYFKFNKLLESIKNKFGGAEGQIAVEKILPKEVIKKMGGYRAAAKLSELPQDIPIIGRTLKSLGGALGIAPQVLQAIDAQRKMEEAKKKGMFTISPMGEIIPVSTKDLQI